MPSHNSSPGILDGRHAVPFNDRDEVEFTRSR